MDDDLPAPPVPCDCDLRTLPSMLLDVVRLRDSEIAAIADAEAFRGAVILYCASWHQLPASSLPDDDVALARLAGYGRDAKAWSRAKQAGAMRGWYKASDGRLYHGVVAEKANEAWETRKAQKQRTEAARLARESKNKATSKAKSQGGDNDGGNSTTNTVTSSVTENVTDIATRRATEDATERVTQIVASPVTASKISKGKVSEGKVSEESKPRASDRDASTRLVPPRNPALCDPPECWLHLADRLPDGSPDVSSGAYSPELVEQAARFQRHLPPIPEDEIGHGRVRGWHIDTAARSVCEAARINDVNFRGDWKPLVAWLRDGLELSDILVAIRRVSDRPRYQPPQSLAYFDRAVRECRA